MTSPQAIGKIAPRMSSSKLELREFKHSLATPITNLLCQFEMLVDNQENGVNLLQTKELNNILISLNQLRELSGGRDLTFVLRENFSLDKELDKIITTFDKPCRPKIQLFLAGGEIKLFGYRRVFREAIQILLNNAVESYSDIQSAPKVRVAVLKLYHQALIFVNDTGNGMNFLTRTFFAWRYFSSKNFKSGLGVAKAKSDLAKYFSGDLKIWYSKPSMGTAIVMALPIKE